MESEILPNFSLDVFQDISDEQLLQQIHKMEGQQKTGDNPRFVALQESDLREIVAGAEAKSTKRNTKWVIKTIEGKIGKERPELLIFWIKLNIAITKKSRWTKAKNIVLMFGSHTTKWLQIGVVSVKSQSLG